LVCEGFTKVSSSAATKNAGINAYLTWFFNGSNFSISKLALV